MKRWFKYIKPYLPFFILGPICMIIEVLGEVIMPRCLPLDKQLYAIKEYSRSKKKDISKLMRYAERLDVADEVRTYMEVLL